MIHINPNLQMRFLLKIDDVFMRENEIASNIPLLEDAVSRRTIDLHTTDAAVSIVFYEEELLGIEFWDEINFFVAFLASKFPQLLKGQVIEQYMPQGCVVTLTPQKDWVLYRLEIRGKQPRTFIVKLLPLLDFIREFELLYWRMSRILARLGATSSMVAVSNWRRIVEGGEWVNEVDVLQWVIEQPLEVVLAERPSRN